jgi:hypothetical protein
MARFPRSRLWAKLFENLPPWPPEEFASLLCHSSGKLVGRRGAPDVAGAQRRWLSWLAAAIAAAGIFLLLSKVAMGETPIRSQAPVVAAGV